MNRELQETLDRLYEIHMEMHQLVDEADRLMRNTYEYENYRAYVTNNLKCALGDPDNMFPTYNTTLQKAIDSLENGNNELRER